MPSSLTVNLTVKFLREEEPPMLSDGTLRGIKPQATTYKVADRDGMYVTVSPGARSLFVSTTGSTAGGRRSRSAATGPRTGSRCSGRVSAAWKRRMSEAKTFHEFTKRWLE